jgi:hypothetical protein
MTIKGASHTLTHNRKDFVVDIEDIKKTFVSKYEPMNPEKEFLLADSSFLQNGMVVLIADPNYRASEDDMQADWGIHRALEKNRWCKISHLKFYASGMNYQFVGTYDDKTQMIRRGDERVHWFIKKDSVDVLQQIRRKVSDQVVEAMADGGFNRTCDEVTESIMQIFGMGVSK